MIVQSKISRGITIYRFYKRLRNLVDIITKSGHILCSSCLFKLLSAVYFSILLFLSFNESMCPSVFFVSSTDPNVSVILFRQPAGYIPPSHATLGEAHLCNLY